MALQARSMVKQALVPILLVEDNAADIELTRLAFEQEDYPCHIYAAGNGLEAMDYLHKREPFTDVPTPALILLDLNMPRMNGQQFLKAMKAEPELQSIPVMLL